jgi:hypothetical protein
LPTGFASSGLQVLPDSVPLLISNSFSLTNNNNNIINNNNNSPTNNNNNNLSNGNNNSNNRLQPVENTKWFFATTLRKLELAKRFESFVCLSVFFCF